MSSKNYYVNGNTVRELDTPVRHNQRTRKEIEEARRRKNRRNAARRNRQRAMEMSRGYVVFLTVCVVVSALIAVLFVQMQSQMTTRMKNVANLESQLADLRADNDARYKNLTTSTEKPQFWQKTALSSICALHLGQFFIFVCLHYFCV